MSMTALWETAAVASVNSLKLYKAPLHELEECATMPRNRSLTFLLHRLHCILCIVLTELNLKTA